MIARALLAASSFRRSSTIFAATLAIGACQEPAAPRHEPAPVTVQSVQLTGAAWLLEQGSASYAVTVTGSDGRELLDRPVRWTSSDSTIATVSGGVVYAIRPGEVTLAAAAGGKVAQMRLVVRPLTVDVVEVSPVQNLFAGESGWVGASLRAADGRVLHDRAIAWASLDPSIATVDADGRVRGIAAGTTSLVATSEGRTGSVRITVKPPRANGRWSVSSATLRTTNTMCSITGLHIQLSQAGEVLTGELFYDMWSGSGLRVDCTPIAGKPGPYITPATPAGPLTGTVADNGYVVLSATNGWQLTGFMDRATGTWSGTLTYANSSGSGAFEPVPLHTGTFTATRR